MNDSIRQNSTENNCPPSNVELIKNLLDPSLVDTIESDEAMTLINNEKQANSRHLQHSYSSDFHHHLYPNAASTDRQTTIELEQVKKFNQFLINKIQYLRNENKSLVDKNKEQLSTKRTEKSDEDQLNSMRIKLSIQDDTITDLKREAKLWKSKCESLTEAHRKLIDRQNAEQIEFVDANKSLRKRNDELEVDLEKCSDEKKELEAENKRLNNKLFHSTAELEQMKKSTDSCELLRKDRLRSQQKCHVISEKLEACKVKLEQSTNLLKEKSCLVDQQRNEIKDLNATIGELRKVSSFNQLEIEKNKNRIEHLESKLKEKEDLVNEYKSLYHEIKSIRENEIKHEQQTIKALVMINSRYESELAQIKGDLERIRYDKLVSLKNVPDLIEDNAEHDRLNRLKKKYNLLNDLDDSDEVYETFDETLYEHKVCNGDQRTNGYIAKKEAFKQASKFQNGNVNTQSLTLTDLNGSTDCATTISETALTS